ncbi:MAG TPA: hypothetical protein VN729_08480 [Ktedonobacteraceae bacterium]|nr:hypothetical protein [Ktedonobacteraceae bacterium]
MAFDFPEDHREFICSCSASHSGTRLGAMTSGASQLSNDKPTKHLTSASRHSRANTIYMPAGILAIFGLLAFASQEQKNSF